MNAYEAIIGSNCFIWPFVEIQKGVKIGDNKGILELFANLIKTGQAWNLQGHYGRMAQALIDKELINRQGIINLEVYQELFCQ